MKRAGGEILAWGCGDFGLLGDKHIRGPRLDWECRRQPKPLKNPQGVVFVQASCGLRHCAAITDEGDLYTWGCGQWGALGHGDYEDRHVPERVRLLENVKILRGRFYTDFLILADGRAFTWGKGIDGQLGHGDIKRRSSPQELTSLNEDRIIQIACGVFHSAFLTSSGYVLTCGRNVEGVLGLGKKFSALALEPQEVPDLSSKEIEYIAAGDYHMGAITTDGELFTWGMGTYGQLGHNELRSSPFPRFVKTLSQKKVRLLACGSFHSAAVTSDGKLYVWGFNGETNRLALDLDRPTTIVRLPENERAFMGRRIVQVSCGGAHTAAITEKGDLFMWGVNDVGQTTHEAADVFVPTRVKVGKREVLSVSCGSETTVAVMSLTKKMEVERLKQQRNESEQKNEKLEEELAQLRSRLQEFEQT